MKFLGLACALAAVLMLPGKAHAAGNECEKIKVGEKAPPFSLSMADGSEGLVLRKAIERKKPIVLVFWAHHCIPCRKELPTLQRLSVEWGDKVTFMLVHAGQDETLMKSKMAELHVSLPAASDDTEAKVGRYCVKELPRTFVLDSKGVIQAILQEANEDTLRSAVAALGVK